MLKIIYLLLIIAVVVLIVRKLHVIAIAVFFGAIILMLSVTVLRDQLHIPINDYVNTEPIDNLRDKVVPIEIGKNDDGKIISVDENTGEEVIEEKINYDYISEEDKAKIIANLNGEAQTEEDISKEVITNTYEKEKAVGEDNKKKEKENEESDNIIYEIPYKKIDEVREDWYAKLKPVIEDDKFYSKFMGMSPYVNVEYDLGNAKMYNSDDGKSIKILIYK